MDGLPLRAACSEPLPVPSVWPPRGERLDSTMPVHHDVLRHLRPLDQIKTTTDGGLWDIIPPLGEFPQAFVTVLRGVKNTQRSSFLQLM